MKWDLFVSYASELKRDIVVPFTFRFFANGLFWTWFDERMIKAGDSVSEKIEDGLKQTRYGIIFADTFYFQKYWTMRELRGLQESGCRLFICAMGMSKEECARWIPGIGTDGIEFVDITRAMPESYADPITRLLYNDHNTHFHKNYCKVTQTFSLYDALLLYIQQVLGTAGLSDQGLDLLERHHNDIGIICDLAELLPLLFRIDEEWVLHHAEEVLRANAIVTSRSNVNLDDSSHADIETAVENAVLNAAQEKMFYFWLENSPLLVELIEENPQEVLERLPTGTFGDLATKLRRAHRMIQGRHADLSRVFVSRRSALRPQVNLWSLLQARQRGSRD